jgi:MFS family permease
VPANRFGGAIGVVMMVAWAGMACGGYVGGVLFDLSLSYTLSFLLAGMAGVLNLTVIGAFARTQNVFSLLPRLSGCLMQGVEILPGWLGRGSERR